MKYYSIMGDSISTYEGFIPEDYCCYYGESSPFCHLTNGVKDTWWYKVGQALDLKFCANAAYSGSTVIGDGIEAACSDERISALGTKERVPDVILIYIGFNDFYRDAFPIYSSDINSQTDSFAAAYNRMLVKIKAKYPKATIIGASILKGYYKDGGILYDYKNRSGKLLDDYNQAIREVCLAQKVLFADFDTEKYRYDCSDGAHPSAQGHQQLAEIWIEYLKEILNDV